MHTKHTLALSLATLLLIAPAATAPVACLPVTGATVARAGESVVDLANCSILGLLRFEMDEAGNLVTPSFSVATPVGEVIDPSQYVIASFDLNERGTRGTITLAAVEGSAVVSGTLTSVSLPVSVVSTMPTSAEEVTEEQPVPSEEIGTDADQDEAASSDGEAGPAQSELDELVDSIDDLSILDISVAPIPDYEYTGDALEPKPVVRYAGTLLVEGQDYTLEYVDNVGPGIGSVLIHGIGRYTQVDTPRSAEFEIVDTGTVDLYDAGFVIKEITPQPYTSTPLTPALNVTDGTISLTPTQDYNVTYTDNVTVGTAQVTVSGVGKYRGSLKSSFEITPVPMDQLMVIMPNCFATGSACEPHPVSVSMSGYVLREGVDFEVAGWQDNTQAGEAIATLRGLGNFTGDVAARFKVIDAAGDTARDPGVTTTIPESSASSSLVPVLISVAIGAVLVGGTLAVLAIRRRQKEVDVSPIF